MCQHTEFQNQSRFVMVTTNKSWSFVIVHNGYWQCLMAVDNDWLTCGYPSNVILRPTPHVVQCLQQCFVSINMLFFSRIDMLQFWLWCSDVLCWLRRAEMCFVAQELHAKLCPSHLYMCGRVISHLSFANKTRWNKHTKLTVLNGVDILLIDLIEQPGLDWFSKIHNEHFLVFSHPCIFPSMFHEWYNSQQIARASGSKLIDVPAKTKIHYIYVYIELTFM